jgi:CspA family cold shock protein
VHGHVKWFSSQKGFGFLVPEGGGNDIFVHYSAIQMDGFKQLEQGDLVEFDMETGPQSRPQAGNVRVLPKEPKAHKKPSGAPRRRQ